MILNHSKIASYSQSELVWSSSVANATCTGVTWDSRCVKPGDLYVAITGERVCGHDYITSAIDAKATAIMISKEIPLSTLEYAKSHDVSVMVCADPIVALSNLARQWNVNHLSQSIVIGVTGSSGKTSTKDILHHVLGEYFKCTATKGNQNNELGVPYTLLCANPEDSFIIVEMGMRGAGQIAQLCEIARPNLGIITNIGCAHIELLGSVEAIANAKAELICGMEQMGATKISALSEKMGSRGWVCGLQAESNFAFANFADVQKICDSRKFFSDSCTTAKIVINDLPKADAQGTTLTDFALAFALPQDAGSDFHVEGASIHNIVLDTNACPAFDIEINGEVMPCKLKLQGLHSAHNAALVASLCSHVGIPLAYIVEALESCEPVLGRQEHLILSSGASVIMDCYNANPDSMEASLRVLGSMTKSGSKIAVLGDMGELGEMAASSHLDIGALVASENIDLLICCGELSKAYCEGAIQAGMPRQCALHFRNKNELIDYLSSVICVNDIILLKASRSCKFEEIAEGLK